MQRSQLLLDGRWVDGDGGTQVVISPYTGEVVGSVSLASHQQAEEAIRAALKAFQDYKRVPLHRRSEMLLVASRLIMDKAEQLARTITEENGKPVKLARAEVNRAATTFRLAAMEAVRMGGEVIPMDVVPGPAERIGFYIRQPIGVVCAITPFNFPLNLAVHKIAPALAVGNTVVLKPSSQTPMTALLLGDILTAAGFPAGVVNVIPCARETTDVLVTSPNVSMVSFTGSVAVGRLIHRKAGLKRVTLELGSNSGNIVAESADLDLAATALVMGGFAYSGQVCISVQRIYVQRSILDAFIALFIPMVEALRVGDPRDEATDIGPLISDEAAERVRGWLNEAIAEGAQVLCGGTISGRMMQPTVLTNVHRNMKVVCEEVFAPVVNIIPFDSFDEAIEMVNDSKYGLNAGVFTRDLGEAFKAIRELEVGSVIINDSSAYRADHMPYGGVKGSGMGREGVRFAMEEMTEIKFAALRMPER